ncbi:MAG TPA: hypothetical protein VLT59_07100 [Steroidobacteraceae bacterium]|nr:hypothetical protein [Steroidobacteraceae bacterium]
MDRVDQGRTGQLPPDVQAALRRGDNIRAIKLLRARSGVDLAQARHIIDEHRKARHSQAERLDRQMHVLMNDMIREDRTNSRLLWLAVILAVGLIAWTFFGPFV